MIYYMYNDMRLHCGMIYSYNQQFLYLLIRNTEMHGLPAGDLNTLYTEKNLCWHSNFVSIKFFIFNNESFI